MQAEQRIQRNMSCNSVPNILLRPLSAALHGTAPGRQILRPARASRKSCIYGKIPARLPSVPVNAERGWHPPASAPLFFYWSGQCALSAESGSDRHYLIGDNDRAAGFCDTEIGTRDADIST